MDGQLVPVCCPEDASSEWVTLLDELRQDVAELRDRVDHLERENLESRQQVGYWKSRHRDALRPRRRAGTDRSNNSKVRNANSKPISSDDAPRPRREAIAPITSMTLKTTRQGPQRKRGQQPKNPGPKRRDYSRLPAREISSNCLPSNVSAPAAASRCSPAVTPKTPSRSRSTCLPTAGSFTGGGTERTCTCDGPRTLTAPPPPKLIPKGRYGISVWVEILLDKYFSYRPTERLLASWRLLGLDLAPGTVTDGLSRLESPAGADLRGDQGAESSRGLASRR